MQTLFAQFSLSVPPLFCNFALNGDRRSIIGHFPDLPDSVPGGSNILLLIVERDRHEGLVQADVLPQLPFAPAQLGLDGLERFEKNLRP